MTDIRLGGYQVAARQLAGLRHAPAIALGGLYLVAVGLKAARTPLWFDEILTYHVANLDGPRAIVGALLAKMENHPPLDYLARHVSMSVFGGSELAFRLPSIIGVLVAAGCLYLIVLRRTSALPALVAFAFPFITFAVSYSYEGRPYAFLLASMCLTFLAWQLVTDKPSIPRYVLLTLSLSVGPFSHYYGVFNFVPIAVGELWRCWERRRIDWPVVACFAASLASLGLLVPFAINSTDFAPHFWTPLGPGQVPQMYVKILGVAIPAAVAALFGCAVALFFFPNGDEGPPARLAIPRSEAAAALTLCLLPVMIYVLADLVTHAYTDKYVINTVVGFALIVAYITAHVQPARRGCAGFMALSVGLWAAVTLAYIARFSPPRGPDVPEAELRLIESATQPIAITDAHYFLKTHFYLPPNLRNKIYHFSDPKRAVENYGNDTNEIVFTHLRPYVPLNLVSLCDFTKEYRQFLVLSVRPSWIVPHLLRAKAQVQLLEVNSTTSSVMSVTVKEPSGC